MKRVGGIERRVPLLFALLALCVLGLLAMSWKAYADLRDAQDWRDHTRDVLSALGALEQATASQSALLLCAANGSSPSAVPPTRDPQPVLQSLRALLQDSPAQLRRLDALAAPVAALQRGYLDPLAEACGSGRRLGVTRALEIAATGVEQRGQVQRFVEQLRGVEQALLGQREGRLRADRDAAAHLFLLFTVGTVLLAVVATVGLRSFTARLANSNRQLRREATERGIAQEQLRESQRRMEMVLDHIPDGVVAFDAATRVQWVNPAAEAMFGRLRHGLRGQPVSLLIPELDHRTPWPDSQPPPVDGDTALPQVPWTARRETMYGLRADGAEFPLEIALVQARVSGERVGVCVCRDLSQLERMERMKHEFVSMVSHELRTPLTSIRGSLSMLADGMAGELSGPVQRLVGLAHDNSERLVALVNDILDFERLRAGEVRMNPEVLDLAQAARTAVEACEGYAHQHQVRVRLQADVPVPVRADPLRLQQVLANLLSNAIKFSPGDGEVRVIVDAHGGEPRAWVIDDGPGVPSGFIDQLFEPFAQANDLQTRKQGGTGLGLAISRAMAEQMGGRVGVEPPQPGRGALFWVALPSAAAR